MRIFVYLSLINNKEKCQILKIKYYFNDMCIITSITSITSITQENILKKKELRSRNTSIDFPHFIRDK